MKGVSFVGYVTAPRDTMLLGGTKHHESSRFETSRMADAWLAVVIKINCEAGRTPSAWGWKMVSKAPEIFESEVELK